MTERSWVGRALRMPSVWLLCAAQMLVCSFVSAQAVAPAAQDAAAQHTDAPEVEKLGQRLRCPVCQGMPIGESPAPMAQDMMKQVRRMWSEGQSEQQIETYFTDRFGAWVLLEPQRRGVALWVWILPPLLIALALLLVARRIFARNSRELHPPVASGLGISAGVPETDNDAATSNASLAAIRRQI